MYVCGGGGKGQMRLLPEIKTQLPKPQAPHATNARPLPQDDTPASPAGPTAGQCTADDSNPLVPGTAQSQAGAP